MSDEPRAERNFNALENYGTDIESARLTPLNVVQAAEEDIKKLRRNKERQAAGSSEFEYFGFHRKHVHKATNVVELISLAIRFQSIGAESGKRGTRLIYRDVPTLQAAFKLAGGLAGEEEKLENPGPKEIS